MKKVLVTLAAGVMALSLWAQHTLSGRVGETNGSALPGATVLLKGTKWATSTDAGGRFAWNNLPSGEYEVVVSYVGFETYRQLVRVAGEVLLNIQLEESVVRGEEVMVYATRANDKTPTTFSNFSKKEIEERNLGQDLPFLLAYTPSMVVTSDAGNGVGYTGIRIRGSDPTRINVTVNGIPINDSESHGTFWVNMPDFASSVNNIQIQRGVGTSTNGAAAFGASVNLQTDMPSQEAWAQLDNSFGSFNTWKHTAKFSNGLINNGWAFEGRLSKISSDGYIDRASADLRSYYLSGGYYGKKTTLKAVTFAGKEVTYQSWWGTPEARLNNDVAGMEEVIANNGYSEAQAANLLNAGRTFNYYLYENEVDHYQQDHYQLHFGHTFSPELNITAAGHYTYGRGYYEQFREDDDLADYGLPEITLGDETVSSTDLIRRRWLDNHFYGFTFSSNYTTGDLALTLGTAWNRYDGDHFGEIIWARYASTGSIRHRYYDNVGVKDDFNAFLKANYQLTNALNVFADAQIRTVDYHTVGVDNDQRQIDTGGNYVFFNPKAGLTYSLDQASHLYASWAVGNREPVRGDFVDAPTGQIPLHETLRNLEVGYRKSTANYTITANYYLMDYKNQLVLTGAVNDVGSSIRVNVPDSYRSGIELTGAILLHELVSAGANLTLSQNKIREFTEVVYDYGTNWDEYNELQTVYTNTDIAFSPNVIAGGQVTVSPTALLNVTLLGKYVGKQYLDNTSNDARSIAGYFLSDLKFDVSLPVKGLKQASVSLLVNNLLNKMYVSNGYTFGYAAGDYVVRENYYYPQAGINWLAGLSLKF